MSRSIDAALVIIHKKLIEKSWTIATAESLTAGMVASTLASQSGASAYLAGGIVAYTRAVKTNLLGVNRELAERTNCVDPTVAKQMAYGAIKLTGADVSIATTGYAESPMPGVDAYAYVHIIAGDRVKALTVEAPSHHDNRNAMRQRVVETALLSLIGMLS